MKNLQFTIVALVLMATSALLYTGCQKTQPVPPPVAKSLVGTNWVVNGTSVEYFAYNTGIALYTEHLTDLMKIKFADNSAIRSPKDAAGSGGVTTYNYKFDGFKDLRFSSYPNGNILVADQGIYVGSGLTTTFYIAKVQVTAISDTDMTWVIDLGKNINSAGREQGWIYRSRIDAKTFKAGTAVITIRLKKEK